MTLLDNVTYGHGLGWSFTPLSGKRPKLKAWTTQPRETLEQAQQWAAQGNVGLRTGQASGIVVVDVDNGGDHRPLELPGTVSVHTGGQGLHLYYRCRKPLGNSASKLAPKIDVRADGGQVVYPGSTHPDSGEEYRWVEGYEPWSIEIAELPEAIYERLTAKDAPAKADKRTQLCSTRYVDAALASELKTLAATPEGGRNDALNKAAFTFGEFVGAGKIDRAYADMLLLNMATAIGLERIESVKTINSGLDAGAAHPRPEPTPRPARTTQTAADYVLVPGEHGADGGEIITVGTNDAAAAILERLPKGDIYRRAELPGHVFGEPGRRRWAMLTTDATRQRVDAAMRLGKWFTNKSGSKLVYQSCNRDVAGLVLDAAKHAPEILDIVTLVSYPVYTPDWQLVTPGWQDGLYYDEPEELRDLHVERDPAVIHDILHDLVVDFPFKSNADRQNFFGLLLTPIIATAINDNRPLHLIGASIERTGKTKLAETVLGGTILGRPTAAMQITGQEDEREKRITAMLMAGETIMHLDNMPEHFDSASFASLLTSRVFMGRLLGASQMVSQPNNLTIVASGNNVHATGELVKRTVPIMLQPSSPHPERRRDFQHPDLPAYVRARRRDALGALLGLVENWLAAGQPRAARRMGGFEQWAATIGGVLQINGFDAWLTNQDAWQEGNDPRGAEMLAFCAAWWDRYADVAVTSVELRALANEGGFFDWIMESHSALSRFGRLLAGCADKPIGTWVVTKLGPRNHSKYKLKPTAQETTK